MPELPDGDAGSVATGDLVAGKRRRDLPLERFRIRDPHIVHQLLEEERMKDCRRGQRAGSDIHPGLIGTGIERQRDDQLVEAETVADHLCRRATYRSLDWRARVDGP